MTKPLDRVFTPLHRMMETMNAIEPSVQLVILAYDQNDKIQPQMEGLCITNLTKPEDLVRFLKNSIDGINIRKTLFRTPKS
jgi:hypothetical protein